MGSRLVGVLVLFLALMFISCVREIPGPPGQLGEVGESGPIGDHGPPGEQGERGSDGPQGLPGPSPRISPVLEAECERPSVRYDPNLDLYTLCFPTTQREKDDLDESLAAYLDDLGIRSVGEPGEKGVAGQRGISGKDGEIGSQGEQGDPGEKGDPGPAGVQGSIGDTGPRGSDGEPGGPEGEMGPKGEKGDTGSKGDKGSQGDQGPRGIRGEVGEKGPQGDAGVTGLLGWIRVTHLNASEDLVKEADAVCPEGRVVTGGGYVTNKNGISILNSFPIHDGTGWRVKAVGGDGDYQLRAYALCGERE